MNCNGLYLLWDSLFSLDLENGSRPRDLIIKCKVLMVQDATINLTMNEL